MKPYILAIDTNPDIKKTEMLTAFFERKGVGTILESSMSDALEKAGHPRIIGIGINADHVDYMDMLKVLRDTFSVAIMVVTSNYTIKECTEALKAGASFYCDWRDNLAEHPERALAEIEAYNASHNQKKSKRNFIHHNNILIYPKFREVFVRDKKIELMKYEYDLLYCLMSNHDRVCTYKHILRKVWKEDFPEDYPRRLYIQTTRLRKQLFLDTGEPDCIQTEKGVGYKFVTTPDK